MFHILCILFSSFPLGHGSWCAGKCATHEMGKALTQPPLPSLLLWVWQEQNCGEGALRVDGKRGYACLFQPLVFGGGWSALSLSYPALKTAKKQLLETPQEITVVLAQGNYFGGYVFLVAVLW